MKVTVRDLKGNSKEIDLPENVVFGVQIENDDSTSITFYAFDPKIDDDVFQISIEVGTKIYEPSLYVKES